jgi:hypothetical protein
MIVEKGRLVFHAPFIMAVSYANGRICFIIQTRVVGMRRTAVGIQGLCSAHPVQQPLLYHLNADICSRCPRGMTLGGVGGALDIP